MPLPRTHALVRLETIARNLRCLAGSKSAVPMVKCNAYGHGLVAVALRLERCPETLALGVASFEEGKVLRDAGVRKPIWVFSDSSPWDEHLACLALRDGLTPVLHRIEDVRELKKPRYRRMLPGLRFHLKINTGMNRLGVNLEELSEAHRLLARAHIPLEGVCTHLSGADTPGQLRRFRAAVGELSGLGASRLHCANTAAILRGEAFGDVVRPGIGIYGYTGLGSAHPKLVPALVWRARVVACRRLKRGDHVGYGGAFRAAGPRWQSMLGIGYGDGLKRCLSGCRVRVSEGKRARLSTTALPKTGVSVPGIACASHMRLTTARFQGRISMDLASLELKAIPGSWVTLLGKGGEQGERMARAAGTIVYEILTSISARVPRIHVHS